MRKSVCIFCGANTGNSEEIVKQTKALCDLLIKHNFDLVYGGGKSGLMGLIANEFLSKGRKVIGIRPGKLIADEEAHTDLTELIVVKDMFERKSVMIEKSDFFIALPGGIGTLDEIIEIYTQTKIGFINKPSLVLNTNNFYEGLETLLKRMVDNSFLKEEDRKKLFLAENPEALMHEIIRQEKSTNEIDKIAFIETKNGQVLGTKSKGKKKYYIPGGKREKNESDEETLAREIFEELSVDIIQPTIQYVGTFKAQADGKQDGVIVKMTCYGAEYRGELKENNEIEEIRWLNYADIDLVAEVDKKIFRFLKDKGDLV
ncbi:TIGR00730 family Rossman fold protein [Fulvivirgaceae bacterium BMA10]|uniref:AMP nucleosidase n=1 Tax=Splendidivirga corallicola TaxID=3051826 RepID=A0ABT8KMH9_9BACT|nr:TIGR00730 family Rossman fold protein [Fulvivirgaceae bacterium BMA10]